MCLGVPGRVIELDGLVALVDAWGVSKVVRLDVVDEPVAVGDYLLHHLGYAVRRIPVEQAEATLSLYEELLAASAGSSPPHVTSSPHVVACGVGSDAMSDRLLPPPPPPSSAGLMKKPSVETDFWAGLFLDLSVRVEWLGQALDAVPREDASAAALVRLRSYAQALEELHESLARVQAHRAEPSLRPQFTLDGPLAGYLSRLYAWCEEIGNDFERMAVALRQRKPTSIVFSHHAVNASYAHFEKLVASMRQDDDIARELHGRDDREGWRAFEECVEELIWATEWLHMALARPPGG